MKFLLLFLFSVSIAAANAQADTVSAPFRKYPNNIPLDLLMPDSITVFTADSLDMTRPFMLFLFSPECEHCKKATADIVANITLFDGIDIIMATPLPFDQMKRFITDYGLDRFSNIVVGRDRRFMLPSYYSIRYLPFHAFYGRHKKLLGVSAEGLTAQQMADQFH